MATERVERETATTKVIKEFKGEIQYALFSSWRDLLWEPEKGSYGKAHIILEDGQKKIAIIRKQGYVEERGLCNLVALEYMDLKEELSVEDHARLAIQAENLLRGLSRTQAEELAKNPKGKDILWWPGQRRFDKYIRSRYMVRGRELLELGPCANPIEVRAKDHNLFCSNHQEKLIELYDDNFTCNEHVWFWACPQKGCEFRVLSYK